MSDSYRIQKEVARANRAFYEAFERLDLDAMAAVWAPDDRVRCVHPGWELIVGLERVLMSWDLIFKHTTSIAFDVTDLAIEVLGDGLAWVTCVENIRGGDDPAAAATQALATHLFERDDGGEWRLLLHHASPIVNRGFGEAADGAGA